MRLMAKAEKYRSEFGARLHRARVAAGLSQTVLAKKVGMAQSTLVEAETIAQGSAKTPQLAVATGVDPHWLATGHGEMHPQPHQHRVSDETAAYRPSTDAAAAPTPISPAPSARQLVLQLGTRLAGLDHLSRLAIAPLLQRLAAHPEEREQIAAHVERAIASGNEPQAGFMSSLESRPQAK